MTFRGCVDAMGTQYDSLENRNQLRELRAKIIATISDCQQMLTARKKSSDPQSKITFDRMSRQLNSLLDQFNDLMEREKTASSQYTQSQLAGSGETASYGTGLNLLKGGVYYCIISAKKYVSDDLATGGRYHSDGCLGNYGPAQ